MIRLESSCMTWIQYVLVVSLQPSEKGLAFQREKAMVATRRAHNYVTSNDIITIFFATSHLPQCLPKPSRTTLTRSIDDQIQKWPKIAFSNMKFGPDIGRHRSQAQARLFVATKKMVIERCDATIVNELKFD
jgi:hypothetical protein